MVQPPSFDEMDQLALRASAARGRIKYLEALIKSTSARFIYEAFADRKTWVHGKQPTQVMLQKVYAEVGVTPEHEKMMADLQKQLSVAYQEWEEASELLRNRRDQVAVFQTESANRRDLEKGFV